MRRDRNWTAIHWNVKNYKVTVSATRSPMFLRELEGEVLKKLAESMEFLIAFGCDTRSDAEKPIIAAGPACVLDQHLAKVAKLKRDVSKTALSAPGSVLSRPVR